jgi:hypothetical protein
MDKKSAADALSFDVLCRYSHYNHYIFMPSVAYSSRVLLPTENTWLALDPRAEQLHRTSIPAII